MKEIKGNVFHIQKYSVHDGHGIRTIVFLKGCPLRCEWCSNPESQSTVPEILLTVESCCGCGSCYKVCPTGAIRADSLKWLRDKCVMCRKCAAVCPTKARTAAGTEMTVSEVREQVMQDNVFYRTSKGGVTFSGGEPLMQSEFVTALAESLKKDYMRLAIETTGCVPWKQAERPLSMMDEILYDMKHMDSSMHKKLTGAGNELILSNAEKAAKLSGNLIIRVPVIGGKNNDEENIGRTGAFAQKIGAKEVHLLPYHRFGESKYKKIGREYTCEAYTPEDKEMQRLKELVESAGILCRIGG